ncbi:ceramidase domain-containing protein [Jiella mangrovi]|uniref:Ceramidase domain-containing protein n=1 Tax=Jiella mangrovi TaxID=2821407 RepID=A0ABS4BK11_9HYPH|nr:ceramidase domain-containing protein [Jiella mangrovi]MBP0616339.1 ceramidase domain-containing protein [Jiella mangrovi]
MNWTDSIDAYCERVSPAFWAEPLNALSNVAFIAAALIGLSLWKMRGGKDRPAFVLCCLVAVIGVGSFTFHTVATRWASLADVIPIALFIYAYFALALTRFFGLSKLAAGAGTVAFFGASFLAQPVFATIVGSSAGYIPALLAMLAIGSLLLARHNTAGALVISAGATFLVSLCFRIFDQPICEVWPLGTHMIWHVLNAATLALLLAAAIDAHPTPAVRRKH